MRTLLAWLRAYTRRPSFPGAEHWTRDDAGRLQAFLASDSGRQMSRALTNAAIREAFRANQIVKSADYDAGYASGFRGAIAFLEALSASAPPQVSALSEDPAPQGAVNSATPTP